MPARAIIEGHKSGQRGFTPVRRFAEHGFTPVRRFAEHGFTLVELMIVIVIMGLAATAVVMMMPDPRGRLRDDAERFAARVRAAHDSAIAGARPVSVWVAAGGYGFDEREQGRWHSLAEKPFRVEQWGKNVSALVADPSGRDRVIFDTTGMADRPMMVKLQRDGKSVVVRVGTNGAVRVNVR